MAVESLADVRQEPHTDPVLALIHDRTERGLLFFEEHGGEFVEVAPAIVRVPSRSSEGFYDVDTHSEECPCPDFEYRTSKHGVGCAHVYGVAIGRARRAAVRRARRCDGCAGLFRTRALVEVHAEHVAFAPGVLEGQRYCQPCARAVGIL